MDLTGLAGLDDEPDLEALAGADQVVVHRGGGEQRRDRGQVRIGAAVGEDEHVHAVVDRPGRPRPAAGRARRNPAPPSATG